MVLVMLILAYSPLDWSFPWWLWGLSGTASFLNFLATWSHGYEERQKARLIAGAKASIVNREPRDLTKDIFKN